MNSVSSKYIFAAYIMVVLFVICLFAGFAHWGFFLPAALFLFGYYVIDRKHLRCPNCWGFINLGRLSYAKKHTYHCEHCGEVIRIE